MSQPNDDPPSSGSTPSADPSAMQGAPPLAPGTSLSSGPAPLPPTPRSNPPSVFKLKEAAPPVPAPELGFSDFLAWMQARASEQPASPPPAATAPRTTLPKEQKKFHRAEPEEKNDRKLSSPDPNAENDAAGGTGETAGVLPPVVRKRRKAPTGERSDRYDYRWLVPALVLLALLCGSFKLGRATAPTHAAVTAVPAAKAPQSNGGPQAEAVAGLIDQAMTAETKGNFNAATDFLRRAQALDGHVAGLNYHLALLAYESANPPRAITLLDRNIETADESAASYNLRGTIINRISGINQGLDSLETATRLDPFNARYFFFLGEALRRGGNPQLALVRLRQATDRLRDQALEGLYGLKVRLTQIELGQETEFNGQLADELQRTPASVDWLFTAAALEMHRGHFDAAAAYLDKASALAERRTMHARLSDFYLLGFAHEKALARFFTSDNAMEAAPTAAMTDVPLPDPRPASSPPSDLTASSILTPAASR